ncbi:MAG: capsular biosynthesis protein [Cyclobacteriaceae bacterium]|nr:capsular biosynthesis protein [Cyclobacteriaceae bacterium]
MFGLFKKTPKNTAFPLRVDIHSHLLPGLDDGVKSVEESIYILKTLKKLGYQKVVTTPHVMSDHYPNSDTAILKKLAVVQAQLSKEQLDIELDAAAEYFLDETLLSRLATQEPLLSFGKKYLLFETSFLNKPFFLEEAIFKMNTNGYRPVLAHPERYVYLQGNWDLIQKLRSMNLLFQLNMLSLTGFYSNEVKRLARELLQAGMIDFVGTDCHSAYQADIIAGKSMQKHAKAFDAPHILNRTLLTL